MNERSKKKRKERVRKQRLLQKQANVAQRQKQREEDMAERDERRYFNQVTRERLEYAKDLEAPDIKADDSVLERNIKVLEAAVADYEALKKYREEHKEEAEEIFNKAKEQ